MQVTDAQREVRTVYRGGFMGQLVSGLLWLASAAAATWGTMRTAILVLVVGGFFIFPLTTLGLRLLGGPWKLRSDNPLGALGMQVAFVLPLCLPLVGAVAHHHLPWFYPAFMVLLGALVWLLFALGFTNFFALTLLRLLARRRELAVKIAIGATRGRLGRGLLAELAIIEGDSADAARALVRAEARIAGS